MDSGVNTASVTPTLHASTAEGDLIFCAHASSDRGDDITLDGATGYTDLEEVFHTADGNFIRMEVAAKIAGASESDPTFSTSNQGVGDVQIAQCATFRGTLNTVTGIVAHVNEADSVGTAGQVQYPSLTVTTDNTVVLIIGSKQTSWASVDAEAGFTEIGEPATTGGDDVGLIWNYVIQTTAANISAGNWTANTETVTGGSDVGIAISLKEAAGATAPTVTSGLACDTLDANGFDCDATADETGTLYAVANRSSDSAPTCTQIQAGQNSAGGAALEADNVANTADVEATVQFVGLSARIAYRVDACFTNAGGDSAVTSDTDQVRGANTGYSIVQLTTLAATGWPDLSNDLVFDLADDETYWGSTLEIASGDWVEIADETAAGCELTQEADGDIVLNPLGTDPDCTESPDTITLNQVQDATTGNLFVAASGTTPDQYEGSPDTLYVNNDAPQESDPDNDDISIQTGEAFSLDLNTISFDPEAGQLTAFDKGSGLVTGLSQSGTGNMTVSGTVADMDENEAGVAITWAFYDPAGNELEVAMTQWPLDTWTLPNFVGTHYETVLSTASGPPAFMSVQDPGSDPIFGCDSSETPQDDEEVYTQTPVASTEVESGASLEIGVALSALCVIGGGDADGVSGGFINLEL